jgi:hypothetical protein
MDYTDPDSNANYPTSYWTLETFGGNLNPANQSLAFRFAGYTSVDDYNTGATPFGYKEYIVVGPDVGSFSSIYVDAESLVHMLEDYAKSYPTNLTSFFASADDLSVITILRADIGANGDDVVRVVFSQQLFSIVDPPEAGVTIRVNGSQVTITAGEINEFEPTEVRFTLVSPVNMSDEVTFEYDRRLGYLRESAANSLPLRSFSAFPVSNTVGTYWLFNDQRNAFQILAMG